MSTPIDRDDADRNRGDREHDTGVTTGHSSPDLDAGRGSDEPTVVHEAAPVDDRSTSGALRADQRTDGGDPQVVQRDFADREYVAGGATGRGQIVGDHGDQGGPSGDAERDGRLAADRDRAYAQGVADAERDRNRDRESGAPHDRDRDLDRDRDSDRAMDRDRDATAAAPVTGAVSPDARHEVVEREKQEFGGMKFGSAFFGWLSAMGMTVLLTALVAGAGAALGLGAQVDPEQAAQENADTIGIAGAIAVLVILLIAYYCGGYVAGRMARFSGAKQGIAVWLWAIVIAIVVAIIAAIGGAQWNILANINTFPRLPFSEGELTTAGIITAVGALLVSLLGAVLGGLAGMRYHRKVDRVGLGR